MMGEEYRAFNPHYVIYFTPLSPRPKYSPQHPILKHPQPMFLPHCERPSFTPKQNPPYHKRYLFLFIRILVSCVTMEPHRNLQTWILLKAAFYFIIIHRSQITLNVFSYMNTNFYPLFVIHLPMVEAVQHDASLCKTVICMSCAKHESCTNTFPLLFSRYHQKSHYWRLCKIKFSSTSNAI
jgi:hypothetical protein